MPFATEPIVIEYDLERFLKAPDKIEKIIRKRLGYLGEYMVEWLMQRAPRDTSLHVESIRYDVNDLGAGTFELVVSSNAPNAKYALETGRGPGKFPPLEPILGWVQRRGLSAEETKVVQTVGKRIGTTYRKRKMARSVSKRISTVTSQFAESNDEHMTAALKVRMRIAKRGTVSKPFLFTEVIDATRNNQIGTWKAIEADIAAEV